MAELEIIEDVLHFLGSVALGYLIWEKIFER